MDEANNIDEVDRLHSTEEKVLRTSMLITVILTMFILVQIFFILVPYNKTLSWQFLGMIVSTNFAAVWLTIRGNQQIDDVRNSAKQVYRPEILKFVNWAYSLMNKMRETSDEDPEVMIEELAPSISKVLVRYYRIKHRIDKMVDIEDDEIFVEAFEEFVR